LASFSFSQSESYLTTITMKFVIAILCLASVAMAADVSMNVAGSAYNFGYNTGDGQSRIESGSAGNVAGSYSYIDANGDPRTVHYTAGPQGFQASGDTGVDRRTAAAAAAMAALAPKAPAELVPAAPVAPVVAPWGYYGHPGAVVMHAYPGVAGYTARW
ncbi:chitin-binding domain-containing protein, partial [Corynebacterium sp. MC-21]|uniref:chitin-binding domain-containing protein n=1 Tax=Corynebacterium parakroppenstedtii TaxID=2828363 RepID=UPI001F25210C